RRRRGESDRVVGRLCALSGWTRGSARRSREPTAGEAGRRLPHDRGVRPPTSRHGRRMHEILAKVRLGRQAEDMTARVVPLARECLAFGLSALALGALGLAASFTVHQGFLVYAACTAAAAYVFTLGERPSLYADALPPSISIERLPRTFLRAAAASAL